MAKRKQKKIISDIKYDIIGIILLFLGIYLYVCLFNEKSGIIGVKVKTLILGIFGFGAYLFPILILIIGLGSVYMKSNLKINIKFFSLGLFFIWFLMVAYVLNYNKLNNINMNIIESSIVFFEFGTKYIGGGAIGGILGYSIIKLIGFTGCIVFLIFMLVASFCMFSNTSLLTILNAIRDRFKLINEAAINNMNNKLDEKMKPNNIESPAVEYNSESNDDKVVISEEDKIETISKKIKILDFTKNFDKTFKNNDISSNENNEKDKPIKPLQSKKNQVQEVEQFVEPISLENRKVFEYSLPDTKLLTLPAEVKAGSSTKEVINNATILNETLKNFGVSATVSQVAKGPTITRYELQLSPGVKVSKIVSLSDDISLSLASAGVRIEAPIPGKSAVGIEVPNKDISTVYLREVIESAEFVNNKSKIAFAIGKDVAGANIVADIAKMPHLLIAGATGSGKSVCINTLITSILYKAKPEEVKLLMIDPKVVELSIYNNIPHLLIPVVTDPKKAAGALNWAVNEMSDRYKKFASNNVRDINGYNSLCKDGIEKLSQIVVIIDELADLMMVAPGDVEDCICRLAQMARAAGIHLVVATQRPSVDVITGLIKANIPSRISFAVSSQTDSRTILDMGGAEKLLGKGDMLFYPVGESKPIRVQGAFISDKEVERLVESIKKQMPTTYNDEMIKEINEEAAISDDDVDELLKEAITIVVETGQASVSMLQRRLKVGYNRAARLIDQMEERRIVGEYEGSKPRKVLVSKEELEQWL